MNSFILLATVIGLMVGSMTGDWGAAMLAFVGLTIVPIVVMYADIGD